MTREQQIQQLERRLNELDGEIRKLEGDLGMVTDSKRRETYRGELKVLHEKRHVAEERLAQARLEKAESWEEDTLLTGILEIFDEIGARLQRLGGKIRGA